MQGFRLRDYAISALIIIGVLGIWFVLIAALIGLVDLQIALSLIIVIGLIVYVFLKRRNPKS